MATDILKKLDEWNYSFVWKHKELRRKKQMLYRFRDTTAMVYLNINECYTELLQR